MIAAIVALVIVGLLCAVPFAVLAKAIYDDPWGSR